MDIQEKREAFEKLSEIAEILKNKTIKFVEKTNKYYSYHYSVEYLNGAWMAWQAKAQAVPEGLVLVEKTKLMQIVGSAAIIEPITRGNPLMSKYKTELDFILSTVRAMIEAQEPTND